eukprot:scaffold3146_cov186-Alexandrium_tamarense.AAC.2
MRPQHEHEIDKDTCSSSSSNNINNTSSSSSLGEADIKVIILGDSAVGKSKLVERYLIDDYNPRRLSTHALTLYRKNIALGDDAGDGDGNCGNSNDDNSNTVKVDFWDTAGQETFNSMHPSYYYQAHVCILVFDATRKQTYLNLKHWYKELRTYCPTIPCILVANKVDVDYMVTRKNFKFPKENNLPFFFVSSADGTNVVKVFEEAICAGLGQRKYGEKDFLSECLELFEDSPLFDDEGEEGVSSDNQLESSWSKK